MRRSICLRARKRSKAVAFDDVENGAAAIELVSRRHPEASHEDRELRQLIREAVSKLGPTAGQMFALRYFEGYDNGEIAQMMKTSALVVGVTLHRARTRLRKEIGSYLQKHPVRCLSGGALPSDGRASSPPLNRIEIGFILE